MKLLLKYILFLFFCANAFASRMYTPDHADPLREFWRWHEIKAFSGKGARCIAVDSKQVLWVGCDDGVIRYDGRTVKAMNKGILENGTLNS